MKIDKILTLLIISTLLNGCAYLSQEANLAPDLSVMGTSEGSGIVVSVRVVDERPTKILGFRGGGFGKGAEIKSTRDVAVVIKEAIVSGLRSKGFDISDWNMESDPRLDVEVRFLEYTTSTGFWTGGVHVNAAEKVEAISEGKVYEKMYRSEKEKRVVIVPNAASNEKQINLVLSDVLNRIFDDQALINHLAQ